MSISCTSALSHLCNQIYSRDAGVNKTLVFEVFYRDVDDAEKLRICHIVINGNISRTHMFNLTSLGRWLIPSSCLSTCFVSTCFVNFT